MSSIDTFLDLTKELCGVISSKEKKHYKFRYSESRARKRMKFLNDYAMDIERISLMWFKKLDVWFDLQDVIQEIKMRALTSRTWYSKKWRSDAHGKGSKATTFLYIVIKHVIMEMLRKKPKEIPFSQLDNTRQVLQNGYYREFEVTLDESVLDDENYDCLEGVIDVQKELKESKPLLSYIFYGYLMGYKNSEIARKLSVTDMYIGIEWNKFVQKFRRSCCNILPSFQKELSELTA